MPNEKLCPVCSKKPCTIHPQYGVLPCTTCQSRRAKNNNLPSKQPDLVGDNIKNQRNEYARSIIQPYRSGELSREYLDLYGTKNIKATAKEIKKAKAVWSDTYSANFDLKKSK